METFAFTWENINKSPAEPGVYALFSGNELIYFGRHQASIRQRLGEHKAGDAGPCTQGASAYWREPTQRPVAREKELLLAYRNRYGRLPRCNERIG